MATLIAKNSVELLVGDHQWLTCAPRPSQLGVPASVNTILQWVRTIHTYSDGTSQSFLNVTTADAADIRNRVQVQLEP